MPEGWSCTCFCCLLTIFGKRKSIFFGKFNFWLRAGLQEPLEVDFGCQKRQKPSPFWSSKSRFFGLFCDDIFGMDSRCFLVAIWTILGSQLADFWSLFGIIFRMLLRERDFLILIPLWSFLLVLCLGVVGNSSQNHIKTETKSWWKFVTFRSDFFKDLGSILGSQKGHFGGRFSKEIHKNFNWNFDDFFVSSRQNGVYGSGPPQGAFYYLAKARYT